MIRSPALILALLTGLNLLNYLDRYVLSAVLPRIEEELHLSHLVGGTLATVFLIGYFATSPIFGTLADRGTRKGLMALGVGLWSVATLASGLATSTIGLLCARALVGVGEASYATLAPTIIDDLSPPEKKGKNLAIFYLAMPLGSALGFIIGGLVEGRFGWRASFFVAGAPGLLLAALVLLLSEPERRFEREKPRVLSSIGTLVAVPLYRRAVFGYCASTFAVGGFAFWAPTFLYKTYGLSLGAANAKFGTLTVAGGIVGTLLGGYLCDRVARTMFERVSPKRPPEGAYRDDAERLQVPDRMVVLAGLRVSAYSGLAAAPLAFACFMAPSPTLFFALVFVCEVAIFLASSPINAVLLRSVPTGLRASAMALSIFAIHFLGDLWSPPLVGALADHVPMRLAMMALPLAFAASAIFWWVRERAATGTTAAS